MKDYVFIVRPDNTEKISIELPKGMNTSIKELKEIVFQYVKEKDIYFFKNLEDSSEELYDETTLSENNVSNGSTLVWLTYDKYMDHIFPTDVKPIVSGVFDEVLRENKEKLIETIKQISEESCKQFSDTVVQLKEYYSQTMAVKRIIESEQLRMQEILRTVKLVNS